MEEDTGKQVELKRWEYFSKGADSELKVVFQDPESGCYARADAPDKWLESRDLISVLFGDIEADAKRMIREERGLEYIQNSRGGKSFVTFKVMNGRNPIEVCKQLVLDGKALEARPLLHDTTIAVSESVRWTLRGLHKHKPRKYGR